MTTLKFFVHFCEPFGEYIFDYEYWKFALQRPLVNLFLTLFCKVLPSEKFPQHLKVKIYIVRVYRKGLTFPEILVF